MLKKNRAPCTRLSRSLRVIESDVGRSSTYNFVLVIDSNYRPTSYRFRDNHNVGRKTQVYHTPIHVMPPLTELPWEIRKLIWVQKLDDGPIKRYKIWRFTIYTIVSTQFQH